MSGINITDECVNAFNDLKQKHLYSFVIFKIDKDQKNVVVDCKGEKDATHADFTKALLDAKDEGRYAVYDYKFGDKKSKLVFLMWVKEDIPVKQRMIYSATKAAVKKMSSGIKVKDECKDVFEELKIGHKYSYIIYRIDKDMKFIEVDCVGKLGESYDSFCQKLIEAGNNKEGRYAVMDCQYAKDKASKLVFMMWLPDNQLGIKQKMIYSSSKKALRDKLQGIGKEMQCNDTDDLAWSAMVEKCQSKYD